MRVDPGVRSTGGEGGGETMGWVNGGAGEGMGRRAWVGNRPRLGWGRGVREAKVSQKRQKRERVRVGAVGAFRILGRGGRGGGLGGGGKIKRLL